MIAYVIKETRLQSNQIYIGLMIKLMSSFCITLLEYFTVRFIIQQTTERKKFPVIFFKLSQIEFQR